MMVLTGGMGTLFGPVIGAFIIVLASDLASALWDRWMLIMGAMFVFFVLFARGGLWAHRKAATRKGGQGKGI